MEDRDSMSVEKKSYLDVDFDAENLDVLGRYSWDVEAVNAAEPVLVEAEENDATLQKAPISISCPFS